MLRRATFFSVHCRERATLAAIAARIAEVLGCELQPWSARGAQGALRGAVLGLDITLNVGGDEGDVAPEGTVFFLSAAPTVLAEQAELPSEDIEWTDISGYMADLLTLQTGWTWRTGPRDVSS